MRAIATLVVLACTTLSLLGQSTSAATFNPSRPVQFFAVKQRNLIDALLSFGQQEHVPIAIEYIDKPAFRRLLTFEFRNRPASDVLDTITQAVGYQWHLSRHVVSVTHRGALVGKSNLLNVRIPQFRIGETSMHEAGLALYLHLYFILNPHSNGIAGDSPGGNPAFRTGPFDLTNATVRDILNQIVAQHSNGAWVVQQPPWTMGKDMGRGLWKVVEYDRADADYSRGFQVWGLGLQTP
jgi:hypothetical protein